MKKLTAIGFVVALLVLALLSGGIGGYKIAMSSIKIVDKLDQAPPPTQATKNLYDGSNLTLAEMYESLQSATGNDFDHRLLMYQIAIKQNEIGFLRIAKEKSLKDPMKDYSVIQIDQNDLVVKMLYEWQRQWGYNHH